MKKQLSLLLILVFYLYLPILGQQPSNEENASRPRRTSIIGAPRSMEDVKKFEQAINRNKQLVGFISYYFDGCYNLAALNALLGNKPEALKWLEKATERGLIDPEIINNDPDIEILRTESSFKEIVASIEAKKDKLFKDPLFIKIDGPQTDEKKKLPLLIVLHGEAENASNMFDICSATAKAHGVVLAAPQGEYVIGEGHYQWGRRLEAQEAVLKAIEQAKEKYSIDPEKIYLMGFSQGATYSLTIGLTNPERFAGIIAIAPRYLHRLVDKSLEKAKGRQIAVYLANGENDDPHLIANNRLAKELLTKAGLKVGLQFYRDTGHAFPNNLPAEIEKAFLWIEKK
ncbi:MAG: phospholipase/carboxylesterase [bacterium]|nr:MAG: phospholipase/carboxylesterase [bacterium]